MHVAETTSDPDRHDGLIPAAIIPRALTHFLRFPSHTDRHTHTITPVGAGPRVRVKPRDMLPSTFLTSGILMESVDQRKAHISNALSGKKIHINTTER